MTNRNGAFQSKVRRLGTALSGALVLSGILCACSLFRNDSVEPNDTDEVEAFNIEDGWVTEYSMELEGPITESREWYLAAAAARSKIGENDERDGTFEDSFIRVVSE